MAVLDLLFGKSAIGEIGDLKLDATISENHEYKNTITQFPVETGSDITDHIKRDPDMITMEGFITNTPLNVLYRLATGKPVKKSVQLAQDILLRISGRKINGEYVPPELVKIVTGLRVYTDMAMESLTIPRDRSTGASLNFTAKFVKVRKIESALVEVPNPSEDVTDQTRNTTNKGNQKPSTPTPTQTADVSTAKQLFYSVFQ